MKKKKKKVREWTLPGFKAGKLQQSKQHGVGKRTDKWISGTEYRTPDKYNYINIYINLYMHKFMHLYNI